MGQDAKGPAQDAIASAPPAPASEQKQKVYTEAEVESIRREMQGHKDRGVAEAMRWANVGVIALKEREAKIAALTAERDELLIAKEGGADLVAINKRLKEERSALEKERAEFNLDKAAHEEEKAKVNEHKRQEKIKEIATEFKVSPENILELNPRTEEEIRKIAKILQSATPAPAAPPPAPLKDGGSGAESNEDILRKMYPKTPPPTR